MMRTRFKSLLMGLTVVLVFSVCGPVGSAQAVDPVKFWVSNTSSKTLILSGIDTTVGGPDRTKPNRQLPPINTMIRPGSQQMFLMDWSWTAWNDALLEFRVEEPDGKFLGLLWVELRVRDFGIRHSKFRSSPAEITVETGGQDIFVRDAKKTTVDADLPLWDADEQKTLLDDLCANKKAVCRFVITPRTQNVQNPVSATSSVKQIGKAVDNSSCDTIPNTITEADSRTLSSSWSVEISAEYGFSKAFTVGIKAAYSGSLSQTTNFTTSMTMQIPVFMYGSWVSSVPVKRYSGTWTVSVDNTTWTIKKATFDIPDKSTSDGAHVVPMLRDMTPTEIDTIKKRRTCPVPSSANGR